MKDTKKPIRIAIFNALDGNVSQGVADVSVYDEKSKAGENDEFFIILGSQTESDESTSDAFITKSGIEILIYHKTGSEVSKDTMDEIYETVMEILMPTPSSVGITEPAGFVLTEAKRESSITQSVSISPTQSILVTAFRLVFTITQQ